MVNVWRCRVMVVMAVLNTDAGPWANRDAVGSGALKQGMANGIHVKNKATKK